MGLRRRPCAGRLRLLGGARSLLDRSRRGLGLRFRRGRGSRTGDFLRSRLRALFSRGRRLRRLLRFLSGLGLISPYQFRWHALRHPGNALREEIAPLAWQLLLSVREPVSRVKVEIAAGTSGQSHAQRGQNQQRCAAGSHPSALRNTGEKRHRFNPGAQLRWAFGIAGDQVRPALQGAFFVGAEGR